MWWRRRRGYSQGMVGVFKSINGMISPFHKLLNAPPSDRLLNDCRLCPSLNSHQFRKKQKFQSTISHPEIIPPLTCRRRKTPNFYCFVFTTGRSADNHQPLKTIAEQFKRQQNTSLLVKNSGKSL